MYKSDETSFPNGGEAKYSPVVCQFNDLGDFSRYVMDRTNTAHINPANGWAGGTEADFAKGCLGGDLSYAERADKLVDNFANLAIEEYDRTLAYNAHNGVLDYEAMNAGDPLFMYGDTIEPTDKSPVHITVDMWIWAGIRTKEIERRGVGILALARALSIYRPVSVTAINASFHKQASRDCVAIVPVPTNPMDLSRASWMLASPLFVRRGLHMAQMEMSGNSNADGLYMVSKGETWQRDHMAEWWTQQMGGGHTVALPLMRSHSPDWKSDEAAAKWVTKTLHDVLGEAN